MMRLQEGMDVGNKCEHKMMNIVTRQWRRVRCPDEECHEKGHAFMTIPKSFELGYGRQRMRPLQIRFCLMCGANESHLLNPKEVEAIEQERLSRVAKRDYVNVP